MLLNNDVSRITSAFSVNRPIPTYCADPVKIVIVRSPTI